MKQRVDDLCKIGDRLFSQRSALDTLWQEIAENFYPERADFTTQRSLGTEFASGAMTGLPFMVRRELSDQIAAMVRPRGKQWFGLIPQDEELSEQSVIIDWGKWASKIQYRAMYDQKARLQRATKETDNDYVSFGQGVMTVELDEASNTLLYRNWHLRDVAWQEDDRGEYSYIHRKWKITARDMVNRWPTKAHQKVKNTVEKDPFKEFQCRHVIVPYGDYDHSDKDKAKRRSERFQFMSLLVDRENETILAETPVADHQYIIPRWQTVSGSQYAHSPCTVVGLADARLLQRITFTLLEAGEKATNPPMLAVMEAIRGDIGLHAGAVTWVDAQYDEKMGEVLRPLNMDKSGLSFGADMADKHEEMIRQAFYLNKIMLPPYDGKAMTATEVRTRTEEYIRSALPLFEPIEAEYSGQLCEKTFNILLRNGAFGPPQSWPEQIRGANLKWSFQSPLADALERQDSVVFQDSAGLLAVAAQIDPSLKGDWDARKDFRKAMRGLGATLVDQQAADEGQEQAQAATQLQGLMGEIGQGAGVAEQVGKAMQALGGSGQPMPPEMAAA